MKTSRARFLLRLWALAVSILVLFLLALTLSSSRNKPVSLKNGTIVEWLGVTVGTNDLRLGSPLEKLLGSRLPPAGFSILGKTLLPPRVHNHMHESELTAWIRLRGHFPQALSLPDRSLRLTLANRSGRTIDHPVDTPYYASPLAFAKPEIVFSIPLHAFPRSEKNVLLRLHFFDEHQAEELVEFQFRNPLPARPQTWSPPVPMPATNHVEGHSFALSKIQLDADPAILTFSTSPSWTLLEASISDEEGNRFKAQRRYSRRAGTHTAEFEFALERRRPWNVEALFLRADSFPMTHFDYPEEERRVVTLPLGAVGVAVTNTAGERFLITYDGRALFIREESDRICPYWVLLEARDEAGKRAGFGGGEGWNRNRKGPYLQYWYAARPYPKLTFELACPKIVKQSYLVVPP